MLMKTAFLSSTTKDLAEYRDPAYRAIEGLKGYHCVRMEDFGACDWEADEFCRARVAECNVFVGVVGHRYGSCPSGSEQSYTEREYEAAVAAVIPRLMFIAPEDFPLPVHLTESDEKRAKQHAFRERVNTERIRAIFTSPEDLKYRVAQAIHNWEREPASVERELFKGRGRVVNEDLFQYPASEEEIDDYYEGRAPLTWNVVAAQGIIERDQQAELLERLITPSGQTRMICIVGEPGAGKSSLAWQLARELTRQQDNPILHILDNTDDGIWYSLSEFWTRIQQPFYVLVDDVFHDESVLHTLKKLDSKLLPLTILTTSKTNEYRDSDRFTFPVERVDLLEPSQAEKTRILSKLGKEWAQLTPEQRARLGAANQFLILMMEVTTGKGWIKVIHDTLNRLRQQDEVVYRAYEYLCYTYQYDVSMPTSLLERLDDEGRFYRLLDEPAAKGLIFPDESRPGNLRVGHPLWAEHSARLYRRDPRSVFGEILEPVDVKSWGERRFVAHLLREMARRATEPRLPDILERNAAVIEDVQREATISEMMIWRALYQHLGRQGEAKRCVDMALSKEPTGGIDLATLLSLYRERGQEAAMLPKFWQWLAGHPQDISARQRYLGLVERQAPEQIIQVIEETSDWLADHPQDSSVVRTAYLGLVRKGTDAQVAQAIKETGAWLTDHPEDSHVRTAYWGLVERRGTDEQVAQVIKETGAWLADHPEDSHVRTAYLGLVRKGTDAQVAQAIEETVAWLADHPQDHHIRAAYLGLVHKGTDAQVAQAIGETSAWLTDRPQDVETRRTYLGLVERKGAAEQVAQVIEETSGWLADHPQDNYVRMTYLGLVERKGTAEQVAQMIQETDTWLADHPQDHQVRLTHLGLVERHAPEQISRVIEKTSAWLADYPQDSHVRIGYLGLVQRKGTAERIAQVIEETSAWLADYPQDHYIRAAYLGLVKRNGTDAQVTQAIEEMSAWLADHPEDIEVRKAYLGLVRRKGTAEQISQVIEETAAWLAEHLEDIEIRTHYLSLVKRKGTLEQKAQAIKSTKAQLPHCPKGSSILVLYRTLVSQLAEDKQSIQLLDPEYLEDARKRYECIVAKEPQNEGALYGYGRLLLGLEEFAEAAEQFRAILSLHKGHTAARRGLALALNGLRASPSRE